MQALKYEGPGNAFDLAFHQFPISPLCGFQPDTLDVGIGGGIQFSNERTEQIHLILCSERENVLRDVPYRPCHDISP